MRPTIKKSMTCNAPPSHELVPKTTLKIIGTVHGTETPVGGGTIPAAITR